MNSLVDVNYLLECASHSPVVNNRGAAPADVEAEVHAGYAAIAARIDRFEPDLLVLFGTDHASTFALSVMPPACVGVRAHSLGDYDLPKGLVRTDAAIGEACIASLHEQGVDVAGSYDMQLDHGFTQLLHLMFGRYDRYPVLPIFINCASEFRMPPKRARALGEAVGRFVRETGRRTVFVGSGGLSHDPPTPKVSADMSADVRQRLIEGVTWTDPMLVDRTAKVYAAIKDYAEGRSSLKPLDPHWDARFLADMASGDLERLSSYTDAAILAEAGRGGGEVRTWIAAAAAMTAAAGGYEAVIDYARAVPEWMTGMAMLHANAPSRNERA
jgi:2,3-dihydroxyphenylpropionate 1,2-dioxygenase